MRDEQIERGLTWGLRCLVALFAIVVIAQVWHATKGLVLHG